ncbi:MAG: Spx/MgsR family transcriptional regulator [Glaciecola sp.]
MTTLYGIPNCDTLKKAKKWLESNQIEYQFHDYRKDGLDEQWLINTEATVGWESMLNQRGTTFRKLTDEQKNEINRETALALMLEFPAMIKRPILFNKGSYYVGFNTDNYTKVFA